MIDSWSKFNYGHSVTTTNQFLSFSEGGSELIAIIPAKGYSLGSFATALRNALRDAGTLDYIVTVNRSSNTLTISAPTDFELLVSTGTTLGTSIFSLAGFSGADRTGTNTYTGNLKSGSEYYPQFKLQSYVPSDNFQVSFDATVNKSASGRVEIVRYGIEKFIECDLKFITNLPMDNIVIKNNPSGLEDAIDFLQYITLKNNFEFVADVASPSTFEEVILESSPGYPNGTGYKLKELLDQNARDIYDIGLLKLRVIE